jgi:saccharopine dehydrogenase (NAD+, L-lysine forming)
LHSFFSKPFIRMTNIGIIREGRVPADRRAPLSPLQCKELKNKFLDIQIFIQPSPNRCFTDAEYEAEGILLKEDLTHCDILLGIKEVPISMLIPNKLYFFFSHTIKKQLYNRPLLQAILEKNITLIDYETLTNSQGERLVAFGRYAGLVGTYNALWTYGKRFGLYELKRAYQCFDKIEVFQELEKVKLPPIKIALTGGGRVVGGATELLEKVGIRKVSPQDYLQIADFGEPVYVQLRSADYHVRKDGKPFASDDFYKNPQDFESAFYPYTEVTDLLIACAYWHPKAPKLFTSKQMQQPDFAIKVVADLTCDIDGSIPCTQRATTIQAPIYDYNPFTQDLENPLSKQTNITVMAIDNLPTEMPRDASSDFGGMMIQSVFPHLFGTDSEGVISRAIIANKGNLTKNFAYLQDFVEEEMEVLALPK